VCGICVPHTLYAKRKKRKPSTSAAASHEWVTTSIKTHVDSNDSETPYQPRKNKKENLSALAIAEEVPAPIDNDKGLRFDSLAQSAQSLVREPVTAAPQESSAPFVMPEAPTSTLPWELQNKERFDVQESALKRQAMKEKTEVENLVELNFQDADLETVMQQFQEMFNVTFLTDALIAPVKGKALVKGNKITFKTHRLLSKKEAWNLLITFLDMAKLTLVPADESGKLFRIKSLDSAFRSALPTYIGVDSSTLEDNDELIRFVYFIENNTLENIQKIVDSLKSQSAIPIYLADHKAFILTDTAYNIKMLMKIVKEFDKVTIPQSMAVLKLRRVDAEQVKALYDDIMKADEQFAPGRLFGSSAKKSNPNSFLPENTTIIAEPRTNTLILLGTKDAIKKIEDFIIKNIDVELDQPFSPLHVMQLRYAEAKTVADIMNSTMAFQGGSKQAATYGGLRGQDKYLKPLTFTPEPITNRLIVKGDYEDFLMAKEIIDKIDSAQPQVAIEVLILSVTLNDTKQLGTQIRSKQPGANGLLGNNVKFQTSGFNQTAGIVPNYTQPNQTAAQNGALRLLGNLVSLAQGLPAGNTVVTLGSDIFGVWGIFQVLSSLSNTQVISNPFLVATNKKEAVVALGQTRRVQTSSIVGTSPQNAFGDDTANLKVTITPQINSDGMILLDLTVVIDDFASPDITSATKNTRTIQTKTIVADKEVLALGGLIRNNITNAVSKVPILGDIPILGWLFKNKQKVEIKENLLVLISTRIIGDQNNDVTRGFTKERSDEYHETIAMADSPSDRRDPVNKLFFAAKVGSSEKVLDDFIFDREQKAINRNKEAQELMDAQAVTSIRTTIDAQGLKNAVLAKPSLDERIKNKKRSNLSLTDFFNKTGPSA
jgi:general secretion pathway protein D